MAKKYVMAKRSDGESDIVLDQEIGPEPIIDIWLNFETPADQSGDKDPTQGAELLHEPPDGGAIFRLIRFTREMTERSAEEALALHKAINSTHMPTLEELKAAKHPSMHMTDTLNYFILISGKLWALSENEDVLLEPGDCIIQKGCMHGWRVDGDEPAVLGCVLIDAQPA